MTGKDTTMMILAFIAGFILVAILFGGSSGQQSDKQPPAPPPASAPDGMQKGQMVGLGDGYFVYLSPEDRFFLCRMQDGRLKVEDVFKLQRKEQTYHAGVSETVGHGWAFESLSRQKEAVLEARCKQFESAVTGSPVDKQDWDKLEKLAQEIAVAGGIDFLKGRLDPKQDWSARRAAALPLGERGYIEAVPALTEMLLEGPEVREKAANLLVKLTGEDYFEGPKSERQNKAREAYKKWHEKHLEGRAEKD